MFGAAVTAAPLAALSPRAGFGGNCRRFAQRVPLPAVACLRNDSQGVNPLGPLPGGDRPVFESSPPCGEVTLFDARDAMDACSGLSGQEAEACFLCFGVDRDRVQRWYPVVSQLENSLALTDEEEDTDAYKKETEPKGWHLPEPMEEIFAMWADFGDALKRYHDSSAR